MFRSSCLCALICLLLRVSPARAEEPASPTINITFDEAMSLAAARGPNLGLADARIIEADGALAEARVSRNNPTLQVSVGPRLSDERGASVDAEVRALQWIETGGRRRHRVDEAQARVDASRAWREDAERQLLRDVGIAFAETLYWQRRAEISTDGASIAAEQAEVAARRHELGDRGGLDSTSAAIEAERSQLRAAHDRASLERAKGQLAFLLGVEEATRVVALGDLVALVDAPIGGDATAVRGDLRALEAEVRAARAAGAGSRAARFPKVALGAGYLHEESSHAILGTLGFTLPVFDRGQGQAARAAGRAAVSNAELDMTRRAARVEADTAEAVLRRTRDAVHRFETKALVELSLAEARLTRSHELGAVEYDDVLTARQALQGARLEHLELLREAAIARVELAAARGEAP